MDELLLLQLSVSAARLAAARDFNQGAQQNALRRGSFSQGLWMWFAFTSQSLVAYLLSHWSYGGVLRGWVGGKHCIAAFSTKPTHSRTALSSVLKKNVCKSPGNKMEFRSLPDLY